MSTETSTVQLRVSNINALSNENIKPKIIAQVVLDFSTPQQALGITAIEYDLSLQGSNQPSQNATAFTTLCLCMEFDYNFNSSPSTAEQYAGDLIITVSDTGFKFRIPGPLVVNPSGIDPAYTIADELFVRNVIIPIVATQNSIIRITKELDGPIVEDPEGPNFSGLATIVLLNYELPPVTLS